MREEFGDHELGLGFLRKGRLQRSRKRECFERQNRDGSVGPANNKAALVLSHLLRAQQIEPPVPANLPADH